MDIETGIDFYLYNLLENIFVEQLNAKLTSIENEDLLKCDQCDLSTEDIVTLSDTYNELVI